MKTKMRKFYLLTIWLFIAGCMCVPPGFLLSSRPPAPTMGPETTAVVETQPTEPPAPVIPTRPALAPTEPAAPSPTEQSESTPTPGMENVQLNAQGPWLLISTDKGLWAMNPDGTGLKELAQHTLASQKLQNAIQPKGSTLAVITSDEDLIHHLALNLITLPDGKLTKIADLTSPGTEPGPNSGPGSPEFEAVRAVTERNSIAWSPDGLKLAFIGIMDGPAASVYLYDTSSLKVKRVSSENVNDYDVSWSTDGQAILYPGAESFGTGAGMEVKGVWKASSDGSKTGLLFKPTASSGEEILGWLPDSHKALLSSWNPVCGNNNLRLVDVNTGQNSTLVKDCYSQAAISDSGDILYADTNKHINLIKNGSLTGKTVIQGSASQIYWHPDSYAFIIRYDEGQLMTYVDIDGEVHQQKAPQPGIQSVASYGAIWAWTSTDDKNPGVWISGPGIEPYQIYQDKAYSPAWEPHNDLFFFGSSQIYHASFPVYKDVTVVAPFDESVQEVKWVGNP